MRDVAWHALGTVVARRPQPGSCNIDYLTLAWFEIAAPDI
jgi:hypothetical protein